MQLLWAFGTWMIQFSQLLLVKLLNTFESRGTCSYETILIHIRAVWLLMSYSLLSIQYIWAATWDFQQCGMCDQQRLRPACAYAQSDQSLFLSIEYYMSVKLLTEHNLKFLSLTGGCTGSSKSTHVKMPRYWKSHVAAHINWSFCMYMQHIDILHVARWTGLTCSSA